MASIDIIELKKTDTGERFYPLTHVDAVIGLSDRDFFEKYTNDDGETWSVRLKPGYTGLWTEGFMSSGGLNANAGGGGGGGGVENLWALSDVYHSTAVLRAGGTQSVQPGDILSYGAGTNNQQWYARPVDTTPTLNSTGLITSGAVYSELALKQASIDAIEALIPSEATSSNQLADKAFVNSSIATNTGSLITDNGDAWSSLSDLQNYSGAVSTNDYAFVVTTDQLGNTTYNRYKYDGTQWVFEYALNNSSFTAAQWDAINSGITGSLVARIVNPDWNQTTSTAADYIKNKPSFTNAGATLTAGQTVTIATMAGINVTVTVPSFALASSVPAAQIQSDWNQTNNSALDFIKNKPTTWALSNITGADDLKLIEALDGSGLLRRTKSGNNVSWSLDSSTYLTANQTITLTGDVTGSGTTSIATTIGTGKVTNAMLAGSIENSKLNTIGVTKGGTGLTSINKGAILYASASNTIAALSANGTNTKKYLTQTSNNAPAWGTIQSADLPDLSGTYKTVDSLKSKGSATLPVYFDSNGAAQTITGLVVSGNIQTTGGTLSVSGATTLGSTLSVAGALTLTTTKKIYFGDTSHFIELDSNGFHFSHGLYSEGFVSGGGLNSGSGGGGGVENLWALHDVYSVNGAIVHADDSALANGDVLTYNSTKGKWLAAPTSATVTESTVAGWGFTKNAGTITGITMNGASKGTSGVVDLGTVITAHQDISGKANDSAVVHKTGNESISGNKTFSDIFVADPSSIHFSDTADSLDDYLSSYLTQHQTLGLVAGASGGTANATTTNGNTYINLLGGGVNKGGVKLTGSTNVSVASNNAGVITITGPDLSNYQAKVSALGSTTEPVYISAAGTFSKADKYAGGTRVVLNGTNKGTTAARIYAPVPYSGSENDTHASGTLGQILVSSGLNNAPTWQSEIYIDKTNSRVGIGTTSPSYKLHVVGNSYFGGDATVNGDLTTNASLTAGSATINGMTYIDGDVEVNGSVYPMVADGGSIGTNDYSFAELWANRWYPNPGDSSHYVEWDAQNNAFKFFGNIIATGQITAGQ